MAAVGQGAGGAVVDPYENFTLVEGDVMQLSLPALVQEHLGSLRPVLCASAVIRTWTCA